MQQLLKKREHCTYVYSSSSATVQALTSGWLTMAFVAVTVASVALLFIDDSSTLVAVMFTISTVAQILFIAVMSTTAITLLYFNFSRSRCYFNILVALDFYFMFLIGATNTGLLFWVWDREGSFTNIANFPNPAAAWGAFYYMTILAFQGFGFGRYLAISQLAEGWIAVINTLKPIIYGMLVLSFVALALELVKNIGAEGDKKLHLHQRKT